MDLSALSAHADAAAAEVVSRCIDDRQRRHEAALERLLINLRKHKHEHSNRLHAVSGLMSMGETEVTRRFLGGLLQHRDELLSADAAGITDSAALGLVLAETVACRQEAVALDIDPSSRLDRRPEGCAEVTWCRVLGSLLAYASDQVANCPARSRRIEFSARQSRGKTVLSVTSPVGVKSTQYCSPAEAVLHLAVAAAGGTITKDARGSDLQTLVVLAAS